MITVRAIKIGYYGEILREPNGPHAIFQIQDESEFSSKWMEKLKDKALDQAHEQMETQTKVKEKEAKQAIPMGKRGSVI